MNFRLKLIIFSTVFFSSFNLFAEDAVLAADFKVTTGNETIDTLFNSVYFGVELWRVSVFFALIFLGWLFKRYLLHQLMGKADAALSKTTTEWDNKLLKVVEAPLGFIIITIIVWFATLFLHLPEKIFTYTSLGLRTVGTILAAWVIYRAINVLHEMLIAFAPKMNSEMDNHLFRLVKRILRVLLIIVTILTILQQWGYHVTSLIAGLGIGGLAFSLAAQDTLGNWFGSLMIYTDRPFRVGDWVKTKEAEGIVEDVGLRSTTVKTFEKTTVTIPNKSLAAEAVENISSRNMRRFKSVIGLEYRTTSSQMTTILNRLRTRLLDDEMIDPDSVYVAFTGFGDSALEVLLYCFVKTIEYDKFLEIQQAMLLDTMAIIEEEGSAFAFPSQSIYMEK